jgi:S-formylglutathione hydrolase FrmB
MRDVTFHSAAPNRDMPYRVVLPVSVVAGQKLPVVYWLHGGGGGFRDWSNSDVAQFAERGLILVVPGGNSSYYTNSVDRPQERYEDSIVGDLIADVESKFPRLQVAQAPLHRRHIDGRFWSGEMGVAPS